MSETILTEQREGVVHITLNRLERKNALTRDMYTRLADVLTAAATDSQARVVCLTGHADCFSAGNDMQDFLQMTAGGTPSLADQPVFRFLTALQAFPKPLLAGVGGPAVGIGTTMLLHCDHVIAGHNAVFSTPFVSLGLCGEAGASVLLARVVGPRVASAMLLAGRSLDAEAACRHQLVSEVVEPQAVATLLHQRAAQMAALPLSALMATKALMALDRQDVPQVMAQEGRVFSQLLAGAAAQEAVTAFLQKRKPDFSQC